MVLKAFSLDVFGTEQKQKSFEMQIRFGKVSERQTSVKFRANASKTGSKDTPTILFLNQQGQIKSHTASYILYYFYFRPSLNK